ncbi:PREDICTED: succinate dehydrogenase assembly factor 2, mitochondrial [Nelumbo nucifera]|uniref:Succinate dehydrogenase assembly factor 2, mitochondrial n=1 Tax=Nelumbo nucifera TaxID=4432 RepID=A0A1U7ZQN2_NELNU|nr:PREDICTED: succinate dehydrogenase assembly factor 2, mitochondrial [Nelumbo nucifera]XP_010250491.1 PREDICTED: succinate dehydrogenase assembly factor 2, mitochondrial [Nelumbo nucifera]
MSTLRRALLSLRHTLNSSAMPRWTTASITSHLSETSYRNHVGSISPFSSNIQSYDIDLSNEESKRRTFNRLLYRSRQRGFLELDLVLGSWVEEHISSMDETRIKALIDVLDLENPDLWNWLTGQDQPPEAVNQNPVFSSLRDKVMNNLNSHSAPETRAIPGQPWVRGWDDIKKGRDSPISGNQ